MLIIFLTFVVFMEIVTLMLTRVMLPEAAPGRPTLTDGGGGGGGGREEYHNRISQ